MLQVVKILFSAFCNKVIFQKLLGFLVNLVVLLIIKASNISSLCLTEMLWEALLCLRPFVGSTFEKAIENSSNEHLASISSMLKK